MQTRTPVTRMEPDEEHLDDGDQRNFDDRITDKEDTGIQSRNIPQIANHEESQIVSLVGIMPGEEQHFEQEVQDSVVERRDAQPTRWFRLNFTRFWRNALRGGKPRRN